MATHRASTDDTGRVVFAFGHGMTTLAGQVESRERYQALKVIFEQMTGASLPKAEAIPEELLREAEHVE